MTGVDWEGREGTLAEACLRFAAHETCDYAPLYGSFARALAQDADLLKTMARHPHGQPQPNLFLYAANRILLDLPDEPVRALLPTFGGAFSEPAEVWPAFRAFCLEHVEAIVDVGNAHTVQTNEVQRSAVLYPAFSFVGSLFNDRPLHLLEVGCSAGLNLFPDRHAYDFAGHPGHVFGDSAAALRLKVDLYEEKLPSPPLMHLQEGFCVAARTGLDLQPVDVRSDEALQWLRACVWPEQPERLQRLERAAALLRSEPPELLQGDAVADVGSMVARAAEGILPVVYHTFMANQLKREHRQTLLQRLDGIGRTRDLAHVYNNIGDGLLRLQAWRNGVSIFDGPIIRNDGHATRLGWLGPTAT